MFALFLMQIFNPQLATLPSACGCHILCIFMERAWAALWQGQHNILIGICISSSMQLPTLFHICPHFPTHFPHFGFQVEPQKDPYAAAAIVAITRPYIAVVHSTYVSLYIRIVIAAYECGRQRRRGHLICSCMKMCSHCTHKSGNWKYINLVQTHTHMHTKSPTHSHTCRSAKGYCISCCRTRSLWSFGISFSLILSLLHNYANVQIALGLMTVITQAEEEMGKGWREGTLSSLWTCEI